MLQAISAGWARAELFVAALLALGITLLILLNVVTRSFGAALYWVDELAIYTMVWMTFLATSAGIHYGHSVSVTILTDVMPKPLSKLVEKLVDLILFVFALFMLWFCWRWFSPLALWQAGFDFEVFQGQTFNFIYAEPTTTLGIRKYWLWLVMWLFAFGASLHSFTHLISRAKPEGVRP